MSTYEIEMEIFYKWEEIKNSHADFNLDSAVRFISNIYPNNEVVWKAAGYQQHILKIHQEMTEIHEAHGNFLKDPELKSTVMDEVGDVFAWIISAWAIRYPNESMDKAFINYYRNDCPVCQKAPCECGLSDSRPATLPNFDKIETVRKNLEHLSQLFPDYQNRFESLLKSYTNVIKTQHQPVAMAALDETKTILEELRSTATTLDLDGKSAPLLISSLSIVNSILKSEGSRKHGEKAYDVFLSYSTSNRDKVRIIYDFLTEKKINVFMSEKKIQPSSNWEEVIKEALKGSKLICVIASPESLESDWVKTEADSAWFIGTPILPILYHCSIKDLPEKLRRYQSLDYDEYPKIIDTLQNLP